MTVMTVEVLAADRGDCLWVECRREGRPWRLLVDGGLPESYPVLRDRVERLPRKDRFIDLAVVSHIDSDHIGGMLPLLTDPDLGVRFGDIWFNGLPQLPEPVTRRERSVDQGESLVELLSAQKGGASPPWNVAFDGFAVSTGRDAAFFEVARSGWPLITLLSPTRRRLVALRKVWDPTLTRLQRGEPEEDLSPPVPLAPLGDLEELASKKTTKDSSAANGSSIAFLLEHRGASCLLAADAWSTVLGAALTSLANARGGRPLEIDAFKLPHHGSRGNVISKLLALVPARHYLVSTNGEGHGHPNDEALARVVTPTARGATLWFNYRNPANERWDDQGLRTRHDYKVRFPKPDAAGTCLEFP